MSEQPPQDLPFQCQHCQRRFKRLEHVQRHERTHTKEAPYECPSCDKAFPRGDLLRRHEKSAHNVDTTRRKRSSVHGLEQGNGQPDQDTQIARRSPDSYRTEGTGRPPKIPRTSSTTLQSFTPTPAPHPFVSQVSSGHELATQDGQSNLPIPPSLVYAGSTVYEQTNLDWMAFSEPANDPFDLFGEGDAFLENVDFSSLFLPAGYGLDQVALDQAFPLNADYQTVIATQEPPTKGDDIPRNTAELSSISRFGSPLPSIRPEQKGSTKQVPRPAVAFARPVPCWKLSASDYSAIEASLAPLLPSLPHGFSLPSRHTCSRYLEGSIRGPYEHMPVLHIPTWSARTAAPDLLLSMLAVGSLFKFEDTNATTLFYAAKAAVLHQLRTQASMNGSGLANHVNSYAGSSTTPTTLDDSPYMVTVNGQPYSDDSRLQTMQAILNLMVSGSWGGGQLIGEAITFQSLLAELVRADGLGPEAVPLWTPDLGGDKQAAWSTWIRAESLRRTKLFSYTFINLQAVAFNVVPCMLTSEIQINTPAGQEEWNAKSADSWAHAVQTSRIVSTGFMPAFRSLFQADSPEHPTAVPPTSSLANYALIFALLQCIFLLREGRATLPNVNTKKCLRSDDIESISGALQRWQNRWEDCPESTIEPVSSSGPVAFNSTALLRLAWIRLHADLGPCRSLASRDPNLIVEAFQSCPSIRRHAGLALPIVQAAHALSIPVRLGISYISKTQTTSWSVQHSLSNLECAIFVSKWFDTLASTLATTPLTVQEVGLIYMFRSIVQETGFFKEEAFESANDEQGWQKLIRHLGTATAMLWAEIFSGTHVFELVSNIGISLGKYAKQLEDAHTPINTKSQ